MGEEKEDEEDDEFNYLCPIGKVDVVEDINYYRVDEFGTTLTSRWLNRALLQAQRLVTLLPNMFLYSRKLD